MRVSKDQPKRIVICADGTGSAFSTQESNVWRLYQALDKTGTDQIAYYIAGVGTSSFRPYAIFDGATGIGVPANVRKLYEFICWNWKPGDQLYMFGFSRGSFTIRTLIGLMHYEGLVPAEIGEVPVSRAEMAHNVMAAWRSYRAKTAPWTKTLPTIWLARWMRDIFLFVINLIARYRNYREVARDTVTQKRGEVPIKFVGLFDTVEAFGVPIEELRHAIDWVVWPISFKNRILSKYVDRACHALSLDDERQTFHPLRFDQTNETEPHRITEVWFSGDHSDVGGGYPESVLEHVPLVWMVEKATSELLRFDAPAIQNFQRIASPLAQCHDSRAGLAVFFRYSPRYIDEGPASGGPPVIHHSVAEKMVFGTEGYAPKILPSAAFVLMPDNSKVEIQGFAPDEKVTLRIAPGQTPMDVAVAAVSRLRDTDSYTVSLVRDRIWWRRVNYFAFLAAALVLVSVPYTAGWLYSIAKSLGLAATEIGSFDSGLSAFLDGFFGIPATFLPSYLAPWTTAIISYPLICFGLILVAGILYLLNAWLRDRIADLARQAWFPAFREPSIRKTLVAKGGRAPPKRTFARLMRTSVRIDWVQWVFTDIIFIIVIGLLATSKAAVVFETGHGGLCIDTAHPKRLVPYETALAQKSFSTMDMCWASGITLEQGYHYEIWVEMTAQYFDRLTISDIAGFKEFSFRHISAIPIRRWISADWFAPIGRIGRMGRYEWALKSVSGDSAIDVGAGRDGSDFKSTIDHVPAFVAYLQGKPKPETAADFAASLGWLDPIPAEDLVAADAATKDFPLNRRFVTRFVAPSNGEFFLYVNDAAVGFPFLGVFNGFYRNNSGEARVTIKRLDAPPVPSVRGN